MMPEVKALSLRDYHQGMRVAHGTTGPGCGRRIQSRQPVYFALASVQVTIKPP